MSVPDTPPPREPRSVVITALLLIGGLLLLAPGVCAVSFIRKVNWEDAVRTFNWEAISSGGAILLALILLWIISFIISAGGIWLIVYAFRR